MPKLRIADMAWNSEDRGKKRYEQELVNELKKWLGGKGLFLRLMEVNTAGSN